MISAPQLVTEVPKLPAPKLLVEWSSRWDEFISSIRPALGRSRRPLAGEAHTGLFPFRGILISWVLESALLVAGIVLPGKLASMRPYTPPPIAKYDVIYFSGDELPQTEDAGGAQAGRSGRAGGHEARHPTQTIRVARGESPSEKVVDAPKLNLPRSDSPVANLLAFNRIPGAAPTEGLKSNVASAALPPMTVVPPTPQVARDQMVSPALPTSIVAPPPQLAGDKMRSAPKLDSNIVPPAPGSAQRELAGMRLPVVSTATVVPPSVSAPERDPSVNPKLLLPAPVVVAPPPTHVTRDVGSLAGTGLTNSATQVVPPPVSAGSDSLDSRVAGATPGTQAVVPPPAQSGTRSLASQIWSGLFGGKDSNVVPPPVQDTAQSSARQISSGLETANGVVPPPAQSGPRSLNAPAGALLGSVNVVPPPPNVGGGSSPEGRGLGAKGGGSGGPLDLGSAVAPPNSGGGGSGGGKGLVVSNQPGSTVGIPGNAGSGTLAMSPTGTDKTGLGGSGGGTGIGRGNGPGSGFSGSGPGAGKEGLGKGSDPAARGGISPYPGTGGSGRGTNGTPAVPGVAVAGGSTINLPSFSGDPKDPSSLEHSSTLAKRRGPGITVVGSSRSGGAFNFYGTLKGDNYTIYIPTAAGIAVMQLADPTSAGKSYAGDLTPPDPIRFDLPPVLQKSRLVVTCILDRSGQLRNIHLLERGSDDMTAKVLAALPSWKFRPAVRNEQPVEVDAILGFNIDTR